MRKLCLPTGFCIALRSRKQLQQVHGSFLSFLAKVKDYLLFELREFFESKKKKNWWSLLTFTTRKAQRHGCKYYVGNFDLSGKNLYYTLLSVNGCCFCRDILSSSLKLPFVSKRAVRHGYWWWALNDRSFTKSLLSILKNLCSKQVRKAVHLKRNSNQTQHHRSGDQWYEPQIKQIKFSNICLSSDIQCTKKVYS